MSSSLVNFLSDTDTSSSTYKSRVNRLENYNKYLNNNFFTDTKFKTVTDLGKFLRLKVVDANSVDVIQSVKPSIAGNDLNSTETNLVTNMLQNLQASEFVQLFLDCYMAPLNSDIKWRLGEVTGTKIFNYADGKALYDADKINQLVQYDEYGRIDTTANFRYKVNIDGKGSAIRSSTEYLVNYFFPPYKAEAFNGLDTKYVADEAIKKRVWVDTIYNDSNEIIPCKVCGKKGGHWHYPDMNNDMVNITFDTKNLMSMRENPTYRKVAFKPINDNISLLQHAFEYATGIVSTYLTEWDISLYIQEGLLSDNAGVTPSMLTICNRIMLDNPCGLNNSDAFNFGVLNGAISKLDVSSGITPCKATWDPSVYPLSTYWWPYETKPRGKGESASDKLPSFYDVAKKTWSSARVSSMNLLEKMKFFDERGAAYSGWLTWDKMTYASSIFTTSDDGLSDVDVIHMCENTADFTFCDTRDTKTNNIVDGEIQQIINMLLENSENTVGNDGSDEVEYYTDAQGVKHPTVNLTVPEIQEGDDDDDGWKSTCRSFVRKFLRRNSTKNSTLAVAKKSGNNFMTAMTGNEYYKDNKSTNGTSSGSSNSGSSSGDSTPAILKTDDAVNGQYSRQDGVSQWSPALYGGPHGRFYSPKTIQAWAEVGNPFLRDIPRVFKPKAFYKKHNNVANFLETEEFYTLTKDLPTADPSRSPTKGLEILDKGSLTYTWQAVRVLNTYGVYMEMERRSKKKWGWLWWGWEYYLPSTYNGYSLTYTGQTGYKLKWTSTGYISSWPNVCTDWPYCPHYYSDGYYEWNTYYRYTNSYQAFWTKSFNGYGNVRHYNGSSIVSSGSSSSNSYGGSGFGGRAVSGTNQLYLLKSASYTTTYYAYYRKWVTEYKKRPLLHAAPAEAWSITPVESYSVQIRKDPIYNNFWYRVYNWVFRHSTLTVKYVYSLGNMTTRFRLSFPNSSISVRKNAMTTSGGNTGYPYLQTKAEQNFIKYVLGDDKGEMKSKWVPIWFIQGNPDAIKDGRPNIIFRASCRAYYDSYFAGYWYTVTHRSWCSSWTETKWQSTPEKAQYIEVDMNGVAGEPLVLSGFDVEPFSNMSVASNSNDLIELKGDIPTRGSTKIYSSPLELQEDKNNAISYPGRAPASDPYKVISGVGYTSIIPWISPRTDLEKTGFEDPNEWCCISNMGPGNVLKDKTINQMMALFKFPTRDMSGTTRWNGWKPSLSTGIYKTDWLKVDEYTKGFQKVLEKIVTTSTFFRDAKVETYRDPYIVENSNTLRTMVKIALHQKAWLEQCKDLYVNNIDFQAVLSIINTCIDTSILSRSIPGRKQYGQYDSIYYHYWIDQAYRFFSSSSNKTYLIKDFDNVIGQLGTFINSNTNSQGTQLTDLTMSNWTYEEVLQTYQRMADINKIINNSAEAGGALASISDYMYSYLNVLYEYRKFFINKRCNKVDGTLWTMRELEGAIPMVTAKWDEMFDPSSDGQVGPTCTAAGTPQWSYKVDYYAVNNTNYDKVQAGSGMTDPLEMDRTKYVFIEVHYVDQEVVEDYLEKVKANRWNESTSGRYIYIPETQKWAELPSDGEYRYESTEFIENLGKQVYNEKAEKIGRLDLLKDVNENIQECKFPISWSDGNGGLNEVIRGGKARSSLDMTDHFPYVYRKPKTEDHPSIVFNVMSGIDLSKVGDIANKMDDPSMALSTVCYLKQDKDYWQVRIPEDKMPLTIGYLTNLSIKTLIGQLSDYPTPDISFPGAATGAFGYMLYPIVEEQANTIPGIGADLSGISQKIKEQTGLAK